MRASVEAHIRSIEQQGKSLYRTYAKYRVNVPPGESGDWRVEKFTTHCGIEYLRHVRDGRPSGIGEFTALRKFGCTIMSDVVPEVADLLKFIDQLQGNVLVTGLGLGMVVHILTKVKTFSKEVKSITVIEKDKDVIKLCGGSYTDPRVKIICADAYKWVPEEGTKFDSAWHDVWPDICADNLKTMRQMRTHYRPYVAIRKQLCWGENEIKARGMR